MGFRLLSCLSFFSWCQFWEVPYQQKPFAHHYLKRVMFISLSHYCTCSFCPQAVIAAMRECRHGLLKQPIMFNSFKLCFITVKMIFTRESAGESLSPPITIRRSASATLLPTQNQIRPHEEINPLSKQLVCNIKYVF